jgi:hypothetical protein
MMVKATYFLAGLCIAVVLAGCGGGVELGQSSSPAPADRNVAEQARLKLIDKCMFDPATNVGDSKKGKAPLCQCYAQTVSKQMSQAEAANYVSSGGLSWSVKSDEVMAACRKR